MQLDLGGTLASVLNDLLSGAGPAAGGGKPLTGESFQQILSQLAAVIGERGGGQLPLDPKTASQPLPLGSESVPAPSWIDELRALAARLKVQPQSPDRPLVPPDRSTAGGDGEPAVLMAALGPLLQGAFPEKTANGGEDARESGTAAAPDRGAGDTSAASAAIQLLERVMGLPEKVSAPPGTEVATSVTEAAPAVLASKADAVAAFKSAASAADRISEAAVSKTNAEAFKSAADAAADTHAEEVGVVSDAEPAVTKPETPVPEKPAGPEPVLVPHSQGTLRLEATKDAAFAPDTPPPRPVPAAAVARPIDHPQWPDALGERLLWLRDKAVQAAELQIHPRHLGPVAVRIQVHDDQTTIHFASQHAVVREALEAALPRLRELFANQQLPPAQVEVGQQFSGDQPGSQGDRSGGQASERQAFRSGAPGDAPALPEDEGPRRLPETGNRLLSLYA